MLVKQLQLLLIPFQPAYGLSYINFLTINELLLAKFAKTSSLDLHKSDESLSIKRATDW